MRNGGARTVSAGAACIEAGCGVRDGAAFVVAAAGAGRGAGVPPDAGCGGGAAAAAAAADRVVLPSVGATGLRAPLLAAVCRAEAPVPADAVVASDSVVAGVFSDQSVSVDSSGESSRLDLGFTGDPDRTMGIFGFFFSSYPALRRTKNVVGG